MSLFRDAFWREYALVVLMTILLGAGGAAAGASALDAALGDAARGLLGEAGQYHLIVHVRQGYRAAAARELERLMAAHGPAAVLHEGVTVAGNANFFLALPPEQVRQPVLEELVARLGEVPGFNGYTWLLEPSLTVSGLRPGVQALVAREAAALAGVRLAVRHGSSVTVLLESLNHQRPVAAALKALVEGRQVAEVRWPGRGEGDPASVVAAVRAALGPEFLADVTSPDEAGETRQALAALRDWLAGLAARVQVTPGPGASPLAAGERVVLQGPAPAPPEPGQPPEPQHLIVEMAAAEDGELVGRIVHGDFPPPGAEPGNGAEGELGQGGLGAGARPAGTAFRLVDGVVGPPVGEAVLVSPRWALAAGGGPDPAAGQSWDQLVQAAREAAEQLAAVVDLLAPAAASADTGQQAQRLARALRAGDGASAVREALLGVVLTALLRAGQASGDDPGVEPAEAGHPAGGDGAGDRAGVAAQLAALHQSLTRLAEAAEGLQEAAGQGGLAAVFDIQGRLLQLRDDELTRLWQAVEGAAGGPAAGQRVELLVSGSVPAARLEQVVRQAAGEEAVVIITAAGVVAPSPRALVLELLQDVRRSVAGLGALLAAAAALVLDHATVLAALGRLGCSRRAVAAVGAGLGVLLLGGIYGLSGAAIPGAGPGVVAAAGAGLGVAVALLAERLSPVQPDEIMAGQALGLSDGQILREIVVPVGRPGLLSLVNRWRRQFR